MLDSRLKFIRTDIHRFATLARCRPRVAVEVVYHALNLHAGIDASRIGLEPEVPVVWILEAGWVVDNALALDPPLQTTVSDCKIGC